MKEICPPMIYIPCCLTDAAPLWVRHVVEPPVVPLFLVDVTVVLRTAAAPKELERVSWDKNAKGRYIPAREKA